MEKEKKLDMEKEKATEVLTSSSDLSQSSDSIEASQTSNSSLGYLADMESGGFFSAHLRRTVPSLHAPPPTMTLTRWEY